MGTAAPGSAVGRRVLIPGGSGAVGEGVVRAFLRAGAEVVVPTRSAQRSEEIRTALGADATDHLHLVVHDYTTFAGAEALAVTMVERLGGIDDVLAPIGGWWAGGPLADIGEDDWQSAFVGLATTHMAVARSSIPRMSGLGSYVVIVGQSAELPVPGSGLVSMEQSAVLMMQRVLAAEGEQPVHALVLGPVRTRVVEGEPGWISSDDVGAVAVALAGSPGASRAIALPDADAATRLLGGLVPAQEVVTASTFVPLPGEEGAFAALIEELQQRIRTQPGTLEYTVHPATDGHDGAVLVVQRFASAADFRAHAALMAEIDGPRRLAAVTSIAPQPPRLFAAIGR